MPPAAGNEATNRDRAQAGTGLQIPDMLENSAVRFPDRPCVTDGSTILTFEEVSVRASKAARALEEAGLHRGDRVALLARNELSYLEIQVGAQRAGVVLVPLNYRLAEPELRYIVEDCAPRLLIASSEYEDRAHALRTERTWIIEDDESGYEAALAASRPPRAIPPIYGTDAFLIQYTSGTTGRPKGAIISNQAQWARMVAYSFEIDVKPGDLFLQPLPMFHIASIINHAFAYRGGTSVLMKEFEAEAAIELMRLTGTSHVLAVPTMMTMLCDASDPRVDHLRMLIYGASPASPALLARAMDIWPQADFIQFYGTTEAGMCTALRPEDHDVQDPDRLSSAGTDATGCRTDIVGPDGQSEEAGTMGEIVAMGPSIMDGYWAGPEATSEALVSGWLHTGDIGYRDDEGYLHVTDRKHDMIVSGGENVYPTEVENALYEHGDVREAAVVGLLDDRWGERVHAVVALAEGAAVDAETLRAHCRQYLAGYKIPKTIEVASELPKSATGKILRREVRDARGDVEVDP